MSVKILSVLLFSCIFVFTKDCTGSAENNSMNNSEMQTNENITLSSDTLTYSQAIGDQKTNIAESKFVKIKVVDIYNPKLHDISVEVSYVENDKEDYLGSFAFYPSNNPGEFLIATQGKVSSRGTIVIKLVVPEVVKKTDTIKLTFKKAVFL